MAEIDILPLPTEDRRNSRFAEVARWMRMWDVSVPAGILLLIIGACYLWPIFGLVPSPTGGNVLEANLPPLSPGHLLGTNQLGDDVWARLLYGGRDSLEIAVAVTAIGLIVGGAIGALSAYFGGVTDAVITRLLDVLIAFPTLVLTLAVAQALGPSQLNTILAMTVFSIPAFGRLARAATLSVREQPFIMAARLSGTKNSRILGRHIAPNISPQLVTYALLTMGITIIVAGALSFLGLGTPPPNPSWGNMIADGQRAMLTQPILVLIPSAMLFVTVLALNLLGEALRKRWSER